MVPAEKPPAETQPEKSVNEKLLVAVEETNWPLKNLTTAVKTAKTEVVANSAVTSGPKYCEGDHTTSDPSGDTDSMRVSETVFSVKETLEIAGRHWVSQ